MSTTRPVPAPQPLRSLARGAAGLLVVDAVVSLVVVAMLTQRLDVLRRMAEGVPVTMAELSDANDGHRVAVILCVVAFAATAPLFLMWMYRFVGNVRSLGAAPSPGPAIAIAGWFVPLVNFVLPARTLTTADRKSDQLGLPWPRRWLISAWAVAIGLGGVVAFESGELLASSPQRADVGERFGFALIAVGAVLGALMVHRLSVRQELALAQPVPDLAELEEPEPEVPEAAFAALDGPRTYESVAMVIEKAWRESPPQLGKVPGSEGRHRGQQDDADAAEASQAGSGRRRRTPAPPRSHARA
jgi:hypothetical protein